MALEYLIGLGHRRIAYISQGVSLRSEFLRLEGYRLALREHNIPIDESLIVPGDGGVIGGIKAVSRLLDLAEKPSAIFCFNDMTAIGVMNALQKRGYQVPRDCSVVGFDGLDITAYFHPSLTTIRQPIFQLGYRAAEMLLDLIQGDSEVSSEILEPELIVRASTTHAVSCSIKFKLRRWCYRNILISATEYRNVKTHLAIFFPTEEFSMNNKKMLI
ncbi:MAG: substrate-binding domain-containing protein, partial [Anaerolineales bacterium]|nr:substrate-binding domain-containing protein [Anaerolineales bacterium]